MNIQARKQALRQSIIAAREKLPAAERLRLSRAVVGSICELPEYQQAATVLGYLNFGAELAAELWVQHALADGKQVLLPRVNRASKHLDLYKVRDLQHDVAPGLWGIREPVTERCIKEEALGTVDFILLPGVAFTRKGARLGYGGGFYDKLLASMPNRPNLVAGAFALQVVPEIPQEKTDHNVGWLVTEDETIRCNLGRG
ncbi:5-formyltetrahydrofolate cyclo-ligase [Sideroxydans lithotrophicus]|uniref:5-formyltetrahydrofolate cyclo-ligase n=1 Tax=Sideroxydans lithotrophicus (strain ES-1) TaxID=580332 RepID=D5CPH5_SIDLE|nr:5-formyltetrahydrofolate cyclo-ligase [Sideroxydans lithotrophicus]ADE12970.1 5-formyltetrahydrofolate cyclo-ligase [Sideroxydans lithotrophicus ES-1]